MTTARAKGRARTRAAAPAAAPAAAATAATPVVDVPVVDIPAVEPVVVAAPVDAGPVEIVPVEAAPVDAVPEIVAPVIAEIVEPEPEIAPVAEAAPAEAPATLAETPATLAETIVETVTAPLEVVHDLAADAITRIEHAVNAGKDTIDHVVKASKSAATKGYDKAVSLSKEPLDVAAKAQTHAVKACDNAMAAAKENLDVVIQASHVLSQGLQDMGKSVASLAQEAVEDGVAASKKLLAAKSIKDAVEVQSTLAKAQLDRMLAHSTQMSSQTVKLFETAFAPMQAKIAAAIEKLVKPHH